MQSQSFTTCSRVQGEDKNNIDLRISNQNKKKRLSLTVMTNKSYILNTPFLELTSHI